MKTIIFAIIICFSIKAQEHNSVGPALTGDTDEFQTYQSPPPEILNNSFSYTSIRRFFEDTVFSITPEVSLVPERISFMENWLWGKGGITRGLGLAPELTPEARIKELNIRRSMLSVHQVGGFLTMDLMILSTYFRQKVVDGNEGMRNKLNTFSGISIGLYSVTSLLSVLSPPPAIRRDETSTISVHKNLAWVHFAGTIVFPIIAAIIENDSNRDKMEHYRLASSYIATAALVASFIVITF